MAHGTNTMVFTITETLAKQWVAG